MFLNLHFACGYAGVDAAAPERRGSKVVHFNVQCSSYTEYAAKTSFFRLKRREYKVLILGSISSQCQRQLLPHCWLKSAVVFSRNISCR